MDSSPNDIGSDFTQKTKFLVIGRINNWKGQDLFLRALSKLDVAVKSRVKVRIVGGGFEGDNSSLSRLRDFVVKKKLSELVSFYDFSDDPTKH